MEKNRHIPPGIKQECMTLLFFRQPFLANSITDWQINAERTAQKESSVHKDDRVTEEGDKMQRIPRVLWKFKARERTPR